MSLVSVMEIPIGQAPKHALIGPLLDPDRHIAGLRQAVESPERLLLLAILSNAVREALPFSAVDVEDRAKAYRWLHDRSERWRWGSAAFICDALDVDQEWLVSAFARLRRRVYRGARDVKGGEA